MVLVGEGYEPKKMGMVMVSQPMKDLSIEEIEIERTKLIKGNPGLRDEIFDILDLGGNDLLLIMDTVIENADELSELECFSRSISFLAKADILVMDPGWSDSRGCRLEEKIAREYGVPVVYAERNKMKPPLRIGIMGG